MRREQPKPSKPKRSERAEPQEPSRKYHMPPYGWGGVKYRDPQQPARKKNFGGK